MVPNRGIPNFVERALQSVSTAANAVRFAETRHQRVLRRFTQREAETILNHPDALKELAATGSDSFSVTDLLKIRARAVRHDPENHPTLPWRKPGQPLPVITVGSQKGGSGKSISAANLAVAAHNRGLRVALVDSDPQATLSLYFVDDEIEIAGADVPTFTRFMGVGAPGEDPIRHTPEELNAFWRPTPWPGVRLIPGGAPIQEADISMFFQARNGTGKDRRVYRMLKDAIDRWSEAYPPQTAPADLLDASGKLREDVFEAALTETFDLIIIDSAPALTLAQLNTVVAASTLIVPMTMRGFDLSTLQIYLSSLNDYLRFIGTEDDPILFPDTQSYILPTIVSTSNDTDLRQVGELYAHDPDVICPVFYARSDAVANAARDYQSIYEYDPPKSRKKSAQDFLFNANAVSDAILSRAVPWLTSPGYANEFIRNTYPEGMIPAWTPEPLWAFGETNTHAHSAQEDIMERETA